MWASVRMEKARAKVYSAIMNMHKMESMTVSTTINELKLFLISFLYKVLTVKVTLSNKSTGFSC